MRFAPTALIAAALAVSPAGGSSAQPPSRGAASTSPLKPGIHEADLNGVLHWYKVAGQSSASAVPVVFLHGGPGGDTYAFEATAGKLMERSLPIVYFEQRGSGRSRRPADGDYSTATLVEDLEALRVHLGVPKLSIVTHSFGTVIGLSYAARYPRRVARMVIAGGLADAPASCRESAKRMEDQQPTAFARAFPDGLAAVPDSEICGRAFAAIPGKAGEEYRTADMFPKESTLQRFRELQSASGLHNSGEFGNYQFSNGLLEYRFAEQKKLKMPVLVIAGRNDWAAGPEAQRSLARSLPKGRILEYEGAGHWMFIDDPERFAKDAAAFLRGR